MPLIDHFTFLSCFQTLFGVRGPILKWLASYLTEYYQSRNIGCTLCDLCKQGSVLDPFLFSLYTNYSVW